MSETRTLLAEPDRIAQMRRRAILSCLIGNFMELYDFTLYGFFAIFIGQAFFPSTNPVVSLLSSLATFGVGFVMRPIGELVMGAYADRFGRKGALIVTMALMALATGVPGLLPGYAAIGVWAPIGLVLCRLVQGFSTGGEWGGAVIFMAEYASPGRRGFYTSWMQVGVALGSLCGATSAWILTAALDTQSLHVWGWRIPFIIGFLLLPIGYYLRSRVDETPAFERLVTAKAVARAPVRAAFSSQKKGDAGRLRHLDDLECRRIRAAGLFAVLCVAGAESGPDTRTGCYDDWDGGAGRLHTCHRPIVGQPRPQTDRPDGQPGFRVARLSVVRLDEE